MTPQANANKRTCRSTYGIAGLIEPVRLYTIGTSILYQNQIGIEGNRFEGTQFPSCQVQQMERILIC